MKINCLFYNQYLILLTKIKSKIFGLKDFFAFFFKLFFFVKVTDLIKKVDFNRLDTLTCRTAICQPVAGV